MEPKNLTSQANRFRFRAWHQPEERMYVDFSIELLQSLQKQYGVASTTMLNETFDTLAKLGVVVMQSTGLLDKNGKEIFEGDILAGQGTKTVIKWDDAGAGFIGMNGASWNKDEVVGNIYENPELFPSQAHAQ